MAEEIEEKEEVSTPEVVEVSSEEVLEAEPEKDPYAQEDMSDIAGLDDADREHLFGTSGIIDTEEEEDDLSDLTDVDFDVDVMGEEPEPAPSKPRYRIVPKSRRVVRLEPPPTSLGGVQ